MPTFAECCVLIPCNTIEDFPTKLSSNDAQSLLGALSAAWHPAILADVGRLPTWYRADEMPVLQIGRDHASTDQTPDLSSQSVQSDRSREIGLVLMPEVCRSRLDEESRVALETSPQRSEQLGSMEMGETVWVSVQNRTYAIDQVAELYPNDSLFRPDRYSLKIDGRVIDQRDFYALAYTYWQIQILTRRLRYTSNLDQLHFENRAVAAARAVLDGDASVAAEALHDCFDALAEERDHYFSSDPSLIDLTLLTPKVTGKWLDNLEGNPSSLATPTSSAVLATPMNVLIDESVARSVLDSGEQEVSRVQDALAKPQVGWCGGGPSADFFVQNQTIGEAETRYADAMRITAKATGLPVQVFARLGGGIAKEFVSPIAASGCCGILPTDFLNGTGGDDESKVIWSEEGREVEALVATPVNAADDASFLGLSIRLGEAIDRGEIATGLLAHWPGEGCDSFHDVRRAASWTLAIGKFWRLADYFTDGEHPYHHGEVSQPSMPPIRSRLLSDIDEASRSLLDQMKKQNAANWRGMAALLRPASVLRNQTETGSQMPIGEAIASGIGMECDESKCGEVQQNAPGEVLLVHADQPAVRTMCSLNSSSSDSHQLRLAASDALFHQTISGGQTDCIVDVPAWGFLGLGSSFSVPSTSRQDSQTLTQKLGNLLRRGPGPMLKGTQFSNEFMEVSVSPMHGGVDGIYSGKGRGNRLSSRWVIEPSGQPFRWETVVEQSAVLTNTTAVAVLKLKGHFVRCAKDDSEDDATADSSAKASTSEADVLASRDSEKAKSGAWEAEYRVTRGGRELGVRFRCQLPQPQAATQAGIDSGLTVSDAWGIFPQFRVAVAQAGAISRAIIREKLHRTSARQFEAPLGYVVEEDDRSTLVATESHALHRRTGDRFYDTLLYPTCATADPEVSVESGWSTWSSIRIGQDIKQPVSSARRCVSSLLSIGIRSRESGGGKYPASGWLLRVTPSSMAVHVVGMGKVVDDESPDESPRLAIHFRVIQTQPKAVGGKLAFCRQLSAAYQVSALARPLQEADSATCDSVKLHAIRDQAATDDLEVGDDTVQWRQSSHGVTHLVVVFGAVDA